MRFAFKSLATATAVAVLLLAAYGAWSLLSNDAGSTGATAAAGSMDVSRQVAAASPASPQLTGEAQEEMVKLCAEHMKEMQPLMEQMMSEMMADMMKGMDDGTMDDGMMGP